MAATTEQPTVGQALDTLGTAAGQAAKDLGAAAERAADQAAQQIAPHVDKAEQAVREMGRNLDAAANTVAAGCSDSFSLTWNALWSGNFGLAYQHLTATATSCTDSFTTALSGLFSWWN